MDSLERYHLKERAPKKWAAMPSTEQAAYETGWLDASAQVMRGVREHRVLASDRGAVSSLAVIRGALDDLERAPHRAQALADLPDVIRAALPPTQGGQ